MKKIAGGLVLALSLLFSAQGVMAADAMKKMEETQKKLGETMEMMKAKKMKMTPEQEQKLMKTLQELDKLFDDLRRGG